MTLSSNSLRAVYGMDFPDASDLGGGDPPMVDGNINGTGAFLPNLSTIQTAGGRALLKFTGSSSGVRVAHTEPDGSSAWSFSIDLWKGKMDTAATHATSAQVDAYIRSGALLGHYMLDDIKSGNAVFKYGPTFLDLEAMAQYSKGYWPNVPCCVRAENTFLKTLALAHASDSSYSWMDFGWAQWHVRFGTPDTYFTNHINDGKTMRLGALAGFNLLRGGKGDVAPWNTHPSSQDGFGMSPTELDTVAASYTAHKADLLGLFGWSANPTWDHVDYYTSYTGIFDGLTRMANAVIGQVHGPINTHSPTVTPPGDVIGDWAVRDAGVHFRSNNPSSPDIPLADTEANDLLFLLAYSRDSGRTVSLPTGWSETARVSGHSHRGGELVLFHKLAAGTEGGTVQTLTVNGSATNTAFQAQSFSFSGNTHVLAQVVDTVGSDSSWPDGTSNMGPVKGPLTSSSSDVMVLICAAKTNDFNTTDPPPFTTMSATTHDDESWNRLLLSTNVSGDDSGIMADYCFINGKQSITSKSWTQDTGAGSNASGAGCGFMVSFKPSRIASSAPVAPALEEIAPDGDISMSLGETLNLVLHVAQGTAPITYSKSSAPAAFTVNASTGVCSWLPVAAGTYYMIMAATNAAGSDTDDFTAVVSASATNHAPVITNPGDMTLFLGQRTTFTVAASDEDGDTLAYTLDSGSPAGATIDPTTGFFDYTPTDAGAFPVFVIVSDGRLESHSTFTLTVNATASGDDSWQKLIGPHLPGSVPNSFRRF